jgi:hypothetical protein
MITTRMRVDDSLPGFTGAQSPGRVAAAARLVCGMHEARRFEWRTRIGVLIYPRKIHCEHFMSVRIAIG